MPFVDVLKSNLKLMIYHTFAGYKFFADPENVNFKQKLRHLIT